MAVTVEEKLTHATQHIERASESLHAVSTTTPGALDLLIAVGYLADAIKALDDEVRWNYQHRPVLTPPYEVVR